MKNHSQVSDFQATSKEVEKKRYYPSLHWFEILVCIFLWGGGIISSVLSLVPVSAKHEARYFKAGLLDEGWRYWLGRYQDNTDSEWSLWKKYLWEGTIPGFVGHFLIARFVEKVWPSRRFEIFMAYSLAFSAYFLRIPGMIYLLLHFGIQYLAVHLTKSVAACWISGMCLLFNLHAHVKYITPYYSDDLDRAYFLLIAVGMSNLRYIGFSLEYAWHHKKQREKEGTVLSKGKRKPPKQSSIKDAAGDSQSSVSDDTANEFTFVNLLVYQLYLPLFYGGPIINYDEFAKQIKQPPMPWTASRIRRFAFGMLRYIFWHVFTEAALHYVYVSAFTYDEKTIKNMTIFQLCGFSMAQVGMFYLKYVVLYGMPSYFSTSDGLDIPSQPQCVYSKHRMTDFWKLVDKGLHKWLVRYIYVPCGGSRNGTLRAVLSLTVSFSFVILWHRPTGAHIIWGVFSWLGVLVEYFALEFYRTSKVQTFEGRYLTPQWSRRIRAFFSCFGFGFLIASNLYFLVGVKLGDIFWSRFYYENFVSTMLIHVSLYGAVQSSMNLE